MIEDFLFIKKDYTKILKQYNTSIIVFGYEDKTPYCIFTFKQTLKSILIYCYYRILKDLNYVSIKDFDWDMANKIKHGKKHICQYCLQCLFSSKVLECDTENCLPINHIKTVLLPGESTFINFQSFKRLTKTPLIIW